MPVLSLHRSLLGVSILDRLAGLSFAFRLQTHNGNGVPLGLYTDTDCTTRAVNDGDSIAAWRDELSSSGVVATQSTSTKRPTLRFVGGRPVLRFDGVDDFLVTGNVSQGSSVGRVALVKSGTANQDVVFLGNGVDFNTPNSGGAGYIGQLSIDKLQAAHNGGVLTGNLSDRFSANGVLPTTSWVTVGQITATTHAGHQLFANGVDVAATSSFSNNPGATAFNAPVGIGAYSGGSAPGSVDIIAMLIFTDPSQMGLVSEQIALLKP